MYYLAWMTLSAGMILFYGWDILGYAHAIPKLIGDSLGMAFWFLLMALSARAYRRWQRRG